MKHVDRIGKALKILSECWRFAWFFHKIWDKIKSFSNFTEIYALFAAKKIKRETSLEVKKKSMQIPSSCFCRLFTGAA